MGDRVYAVVTLGGHIETVEQAEALCSALVAEYVTSDDISDLAIISIEGAQTALRAAIEAGVAPEFYGQDVNYGTFETIEAACGQIGIGCCTAYDEGGGFRAGYKTVLPDGTEHRCYRADDDAGVPLDTIEQALQQDDPIAVIKAAIEPIRIAAGLTLPKFTVSPAVTAWLKIFGEKVA